MQDDELQRSIEKLDSTDHWEQDHAAYVLGRSADPRAFEIVLRVLRERDRFVLADQEALRGLVDGAPATIPLLVSRYQAAPTSFEGQRCCYALGEIAWKSKLTRSSRIDAALFSVLRRVVDLSPAAAEYTAHSLRECARCKPVREANPWLWRLLEKSSAEPGLSGFHLQPAMEALEDSEGDPVAARLAELAGAVGPDHDLANSYELYLNEREALVAVPWRSSTGKWRRELADASDDELQRMIDGIESLNPRDWTQPIYDLARSGQPGAFAFSMRVLQGLEHKFGLSSVAAVRGLIDGAPRTIDLVASRYVAAPVSQDGSACGYALGEIAYRTSINRDPRIDAALLAGLQQVVELGTDAASGTVEALRECARVKPVEGAASYLWRVVGWGRAEADPNPWCLRMALLTLETTEGDGMHARLRQLRSDMRPEHPLNTLAGELLGDTPAPR